MNKYERGLIHRVDWLDRLAFKAMEKIKDLESSKNGSSHLYVLVDFCSFEHRVVLQVCFYQLFFVLLCFLSEFYLCIDMLSRGGKMVG